MKDYSEIFAASLSRVLENGAYNPAFVGTFYDEFLQTSPAVAEKFQQTDMSAQRTMLHDSLLTMIEFNKSRVPSPALEKLAEIHSRRGHNVSTQLYSLWLDSLVKAVMHHDPAFNDDVELAWRIALAPGICFMSFAY